MIPIRPVTFNTKGAAIIGAVLMFMTGAVRVENSLRLIHFSTIVLLFSMMLVVANLHLAGFFDWVTELVVTRLNPHHLLPTVIFLSGLLSAFFVNDIICLVMVPFVLKVTGRMGIKPTPYLLAVATASNIGSTATITGNPQNILIGSFSGIGYRDFFLHLGPVALVGLFLDWFVLWWFYFCGQIHDVRTERILNAVRIERATLLKAGMVATLVLAGFLAGFSPAMGRFESRRDFWARSTTMMLATEPVYGQIAGERARHSQRKPGRMSVSKLTHERLQKHQGRHVAH